MAVTRYSYLPRISQAFREQPIRRTASPGIAPTASIPKRFWISVSGPNPPVAGGSLGRQLREGARTAQLALEAEASVLTREHLPTDAEIAGQLRKLKRSPVLGDSRSITVAHYSSLIPLASPRKIYEQFVANPAEVFRGTGMRLRPEPTQLRSGTRFMMEDHSIPPIWFPVEVTLDPAKNAITFHTLDGHPLRGTNKFEFKNHGAGVEVVQTSDFQGSSPLTTLGMNLTHALDHQHHFWEQVHAGLFQRNAPFQSEAA